MRETPSRSAPRLLAGETEQMVGLFAKVGKTWGRAACGRRSRVWFCSCSISEACMIPMRNLEFQRKLGLERQTQDFQPSRWYTKRGELYEINQ